MCRLRRAGPMQNRKGGGVEETFQTPQRGKQPLSSAVAAADAPTTCVCRARKTPLVVVVVVVAVAVVVVRRRRRRQRHHARSIIVRLLFFFLPFFLFFYFFFSSSILDPSGCPVKRARAISTGWEERSENVHRRYDTIGKRTRFANPRDFKSKRLFVDRWMINVRCVRVVRGRWIF